MKEKKNEIESEQLVREHRSTIYTVCYMFSSDQDEVNDLFQEVLIVWLVWLILEMYHQFSGETFTIFFLSGCIGGALSAIIGLRLHFRHKRTISIFWNR